MAIGSRRANDNVNYNNQFLGVIDEVAIYGSALSSNQVLNHFYSAGIAPVILTQPANTSASENGTAIISAAAYGSPTLTYLWSRSLDGGGSFTPLAGQTTSTLTLPNAPLSATGLYRFVVSNPYGELTSDTVTLTIIGGAPKLVTDIPATNLVYVGQSFSLPVTFAGTAPLSYTWKRNGVVLSDTARVTGSRSNVLTILNAQLSDAGGYQVFVSNSQGGPVASGAATVTILTTSFNTGGYGWGLNGTPAVATITNGVLSLTSGAGNTARSAWFPNRQYIACFEAWFTYQDVGGGGADGMAFLLQNDTRGLTALGGNGGSLGLSGITPSAAFEFNIYANNIPGLSFRTGGVTGGFAATGPVNIASGNPIRVALFYSVGQATVTLDDLTTLASYTTTFATGDLPTLLGGETAFVGFTGADGGTVSTQTITDFHFAPVAVLSAQANGAGSFLLSWPAGIAGYVLQQSSNLSTGSWQEVNAPVTQVGGQNQVLVTPAGNGFYRLALPVQ